MKTFALLPLALLGACMTTMPQTSDGTAGMRQSIVADGVKITPWRVLEDSRCPENARCVWAGRVVLETRIERGSTRIIRELTLGEPLATELGTILLDSALPEKQADRDTPQSAYRFHFRVE